MKKATIVATGLLAICLTAGASAAVKSEKQAKAAVTYRQSLFQLVKSNSGPMFGMAKGALPFNAKVMATNSMRLEQLADMMNDYLLVDTTKFDVATDAKPALFSNVDDVRTKVIAFKKAAMGISAAVKTGDEGKYAMAIGALGKTCKSCHDDYKE